MKKKIFFLLCILLLLALGFCGSLYIFQEKLLFDSTPLAENFAFNWDQPFKEIFIKSEDESLIHGVYFPAKNPKGAILYLHGKGGNLHKPWGKRAKDFTQRGFDVLMIDYRGFGKSKGKLSEKTLLSDVENAYRYLLCYFPEDQIIVYGRSLGTGLAIYIGSLFQPKAVLLESPYLSIFDMANRLYPYLPRFIIALILKYPIKADTWIGKVKSPIHIFHGTHDTLIPYECSLKLLEKTHGNAKLNRFENADHNLFLYPEFQTKLSEILNGKSVL